MNQPNRAQIREAERTAAALVRAFIAMDVEGACALVDENEPAALVAGVLVSWLVSSSTDLAGLDALMLHVLREPP